MSDINGCEVDERFVPEGYQVVRIGRKMFAEEAVLRFVAGAPLIDVSPEWDTGIIVKRLDPFDSLIKDVRRALKGVETGSELFVASGKIYKAIDNCKKAVEEGSK